MRINIGVDSIEHQIRVLYSMRRGSDRQRRLTEPCRLPYGSHVNDGLRPEWGVGLDSAGGGEPLNAAVSDCRSFCSRSGEADAPDQYQPMQHLSGLVQSRTTTHDDPAHSTGSHQHSAHSRGPQAGQGCHFGTYFAPLNTAAPYLLQSHQPFADWCRRWDVSRKREKSQLQNKTGHTRVIFPPSFTTTIFVWTAAKPLQTPKPPQIAEAPEKPENLNPQNPH